jgi:hypothetical protein
MQFPTKLSREFLEAKLSPLQKKSYSKFYWWRRYQSRKTLHDRQPLRDRIYNGDFESSDYFYQAEYENYLVEDVTSKIKHYEDKLTHFSLSRTRHKKLIEDYEKEEFDIMKNLKRSFKRDLGISEEELSSIMENFDGTTLELYDYVYDLKKRPIPLKR